MPDHERCGAPLPRHGTFTVPSPVVPRLVTSLVVRLVARLSAGSDAAAGAS